jgi:leucyl aminopeptidase
MAKSSTSSKKPNSKKPVSKKPMKKFSIDLAQDKKTKADTAIVFVADDKKLSASASLLDQVLGGLITHQLKSHQGFKAKAGHSLTIALPAKAPYLRVILIGLGAIEKISRTDLEMIGGSMVQNAKNQASHQAIVLNFEDMEWPESIKNPLQILALGARLASYEFGHYKTKKLDTDAGSLTLSFLCQKTKASIAQLKDAEDLAQSIFLTRDVVNEPPNKLYPESFAERIKKTLTPLGVKVQIFDDKQLKKMKAHLILAVGQASENLPRLVVMSWAGQAKKAGKKQKPIALVGKGITFDTGGLNLKPFAGMLDMKCDMAGAGAVFGAMHMIAKRKCKNPVVAVVALAENSVSDEATRPSDIIESLSGKTVEILNTDAEGRLVLADALTYVQKEFDPAVIVDVATLTGAIQVALGLEMAGVFANQDKVWTALDQSSSATGDRVWRMPLGEHYRREMDSPFADIKNISSSGFAGSSIGAVFLEEFIDAKRPWAHIDIAGVATSKSSKSTQPVPFATGWGVRLLNDFVDQFEA